MTPAPFFSIVTITYNNLAGLKATEASIASQDHGDYEWLVVDGASTDGTPDYLQTITNPRLKASSEHDQGIFDAMQNGLDRTAGHYVIFMNAGDLFAASTVLSEVRRSIALQRPVLVYGDSWESDGVRRFYKEARSPSENRNVMFTHHQAIFYRRDVAQRTGFDHSYKLSCDWVMTGRILREAGTELLYLPTPICIFERGGVSQGTGARALLNRELFRIYRTEHARSFPVAALQWLRKVAINRARRIAPRLYDRLRYAKSEGSRG